MALNILKGAQTTSQQTDTLVRFVDPKVFFAQAKIAPVITILQAMKRLVFAPAIKPEWVEEDMGTPTTTLNGGINDSTPTVNVAAGTGVMFDAGDILQIGSEQMLVTARTTDALTVTRNFGSAGAAAHSDAAVILKLGSAYAENATSGVGLRQKSDVVHNYHQIFRTPVQASESEQLVRRYERMGEAWWQKNKKDAFRFHMEAKERAFINGQLKYDSGTDRRTCKGILGYITRKEDVSGTFTRAKFEAFIEETMRNGGNNYFLFGTGSFYRAFNTEILGNSAMNISPETKKWGLNLRTYHSVFGEMTLVYHRVMHQILDHLYGGCAMLLDMDLVTEYYLRKTQYKPNIQENDRDGRKDEFIEECCPAVHNPGNHGFIYGI